MAALFGHQSSNVRTPKWDDFHYDNYCLIQKLYDNSSTSSTRLDRGVVETNLTTRVEHLRTMELLNVKMLNSFAPISGAAVSIQLTNGGTTNNITFRTGAPLDGVAWAAELKSIFDAQSGFAGAWTVTYDDYTRKLIFTHTAIATVDVTILNSPQGRKAAKALGFYEPPQGQTATYTLAMGSSPPLNADISGPNYFYIVIPEVTSQTMTMQGNAGAQTFQVPIDVPYNNVITWNTMTNYRQSVQYFTAGHTKTFDRLRLSIVDEYGESYPANGGLWGIVIGFTSWNQELIHASMNE